MAGAVGRLERTRGLALAGLFVALVFSPAVSAQSDTTRQVTFRERGAKSSYTIIEGEQPELQASARRGNPAWIQARDGASNRVALGNRIVLQVASGGIEELLAAHQLTLSRTVRSNLFILQARDAKAAIAAAELLARDPRVTLSYPVMRRALKKHDAYVRRPDDPLYGDQWHLENRAADHQLAGPDLNVRAAWPATRGEDVLIAVVDDGFQLDHPDLSPRAEAGPHYNFFKEIEDGSPGSVEALHSTAVAGLIGAEAENSVGVVGVAPRSALASWVIFGMSEFGFETIATDEQLMDMFQYASNRVAIQNHSWGGASAGQSPIEALSEIGIQNAINGGRDGKGAVIVRAGGNSRMELHNVNDDGLANDPRVIAVAAVRNDGRVCSYSSPGACVLVAAPSGDMPDDVPPGTIDAGVLTTDLTGADGYTTTPGTEGDYGLFDGTSASTPQISGIAALALSVNPALSYRDVQQVLLQSSRHFDFADPAVQTNGAGFVVSHNVGFGVPDAAEVVNLASNWPARPPVQTVSLADTLPLAIPDDSLRLLCFGSNLPPALESIRSVPSEGPHADAPTQTLPLVYVGQANADIAEDLRGKGALIQRGTSLFWEKITRAAQAGAAFAVIFNNVGTTEIQAMGGTEFVPIPAVSIGREQGEALRDLAPASNVTARIQLHPASYLFEVTEPLLCEHVGVRIKTTHGSRSDVRVTLLSPMGTRSVLQKINADDMEGPADWTYWSTQHFYESSQGEWRVEISDERNTIITGLGGGAATGTVTHAELIIRGVPIADSDRDGLDDAWEQTHFGNLGQGPKGDPDADGRINSREQIIGTNPDQAENSLQIDIAELTPGQMRLSWPGRPGTDYRISGGANVGAAFSEIGAAAGRFPITEFILPVNGNASRFFRLTQAPAAGN